MIMSTLAEIQTKFIAAILHGDMSDADRMIGASGIAPAQRLAIYRNNFLISLGSALAQTFPVLERLVGADYFAQTARRFVSAHPPAVAMLSVYGEAFPRFLAQATGSASYAYFADVGALEWAINRAWHADDAMPEDARAFDTLPEEGRGELVLAPHPSATLVRSPWPVLDVWRANQLHAGPDAVIDLSAGGIDLLVWRKGIDVVWRALDPAEAVFVAAILDMRTLSRAAELALATGAPDFDAALLTTELLGSGLFVGHLRPAHS